MFKSIFIVVALFFALCVSPITAVSGSQININTANAEQLITLPGIGPSLAERIIEYRSEFPFKASEDVMNVSGIGEATFNNIKDMITVD